MSTLVEAKRIIDQGVLGVETPHEEVGRTSKLAAISKVLRVNATALVIVKDGLSAVAAIIGQDGRLGREVRVGGLQAPDSSARSAAAGGGSVGRGIVRHCFVGNGFVVNDFSPGLCWANIAESEKKIEKASDQ